jgi:uncharacterized transporter YbjL
MNVLAFALRWLERLRTLPLWLRLLAGFLLGIIAFLCRANLLDHRMGAGRDLMLVAIVLSAFWFGFLPGLVTGAVVRGLALWWFVGPQEVTLVRPWNDYGIAFFIVIAVGGSAAAGHALLILANDGKPGDDPPRQLEG